MARSQTFSVLSSPAASTHGWNPVWLALLGGLWVASLGNWPLWRALTRLAELGSVQGAVFIVGFGIMVAALLGGLLVLFAWRPAIKPAIAVLATSSAIAAYFMGTFGVVLD